ncbi:flippase-like domain-containing protein [Alphaproteobacteria bacterium]|nr:flippase-like domain-containing protein [Alphaproteobacteria bacterium]
MIVTNDHLKRWSIAALQLLVSAGLLGGLLYYADLTDTLAIAAEVDPFVIFLCSMLLALLVVPASIRWRWFIARFLDKDKSPPTLGMAVRVNTINVALNQLLPSTIGGDLYRVFVARSLGLSLVSSMLATLGDRLSALIILVLVSGPALVIILQSAEDLFWLSRMDVLLGLSALLCGGLAGLFLLRKHSYVTKAMKFFDISTLGWKTSGVINQVFVTSFIIQLTTLSVMTAITRTIGIEISLIVIFGVMAVSLLVSRLPISVAGWGVREGVSVSLFAIFGVSADLALATSIVYGLTELFAAILALSGTAIAALASNFLQNNHHPNAD